LIRSDDHFSFLGRERLPQRAVLRGHHRLGRGRSGKRGSSVLRTQLDVRAVTSCLKSSSVRPRPRHRTWNGQAAAAKQPKKQPHDAWLLLLYLRVLG